MLAYPDLFDPTVNLRARAILEVRGDRGEHLCGRVQAAPQHRETIRLAPIREKFAKPSLNWRSGENHKTAARLCTCEQCVAAGRLNFLDRGYGACCATYVKGKLVQPRLIRRMSIVVVSPRRMTSGMECHAATRGRPLCRREIQFWNQGGLTWL